MSSNFSIEEARFPDDGLNSSPINLFPKQDKPSFPLIERQTKEDILIRAELIYKDFLTRENSVFYTPNFTFGISPFLNSLIDMDPGKANSVYAILLAQSNDEQIIKNPTLKREMDEIIDWYRSLMLSFNIEVMGPTEFIINYWTPLLKSMNIMDLRHDGKSLIDLEKTYLPGDIHNWKITQFRAEIIYGVVLGSDYDHRKGEASMHALIETLRYLGNITSGEETNLNEERELFEEGFNRLDDAWIARHDLDHRQEINRNSLSALADVKVKAVVNAQLRGEKLILEDEDNKIFYTWESSLEWLLDSKRRSKYFETLLVPEWKPGLERIAITIPAHNKQQLKIFIKDLKEELGIDQ